MPTVTDPLYPPHPNEPTFAVIVSVVTCEVAVTQNWYVDWMLVWGVSPAVSVSVALCPEGTPDKVPSTSAWLPLRHCELTSSTVGPSGRRMADSCVHGVDADSDDTHCTEIVTHAALEPEHGRFVNALEVSKPAELRTALQIGFSGFTVKSAVVH